jgi:hypothetical protein
MADTAAVRKRRERAHQLGDHSLCRPESCYWAPSPEAPEVGELEAAVVAHLDALDLADDDPRKLTGMVAQRLARSMDTRITAAMARELRGCLEQLAPNADGGGDGSEAIELLRGLMR